MDNRKLLIALAVLLALLLLGKMFRGSRTSSFDPDLLSIDTAKVDRIVIRAGGDQPETFEMQRATEGWEALRGSMRVRVPSSGMQNILAPLVHLKAQRMVTRDTTRYSDFEIAESQASAVTVFAGQKQVADLRIGGFKFDQVARTASTYVRKTDHPDVYLIDGFSTMGLKARFEQFRDKHLVRVQAEDITSVEWSVPSGRKEVVLKEDGAWHYAGMEAVDSSAFGSYLNTLVNAQGAEFSDITSSQNLPEAEKITLYGHNMVEPIMIHAYLSQDTAQRFLIHSSVNPEAFFLSDSTGLYKRIFTDLRSFWPDGQ